MTHTLAASVLLGALLCAGCPTTSPNWSEPLFGSECVINLNSGIGPKFTVMHEHDMGISPTETRLVLEIVPWATPLYIGGLEMHKDVKHQLVIFDPFTADTALYLRDTDTGNTMSLTDFVAYGDDPAPEYASVTVVTDYSEPDGGTWLHVIDGSRAEHGIMVLVSDV